MIKSKQNNFKNSSFIWYIGPVGDKGDVGPKGIMGHKGDRVSSVFLNFKFWILLQYYFNSKINPDAKNIIMYFYLYSIKRLYYIPSYKYNTRCPKKERQSKNSIYFQKNLNLYINISIIHYYSSMENIMGSNTFSLLC